MIVLVRRRAEFGIMKVKRARTGQLMVPKAKDAETLQFQLTAIGVQAPTALLIIMPCLLTLLARAGRQRAPAALTQTR